MTILDKIISKRIEDISLVKSKVSESELIDMVAKRREIDINMGVDRVFHKELISSDRCGIIAEFKRASPSKGLINGTVSPRDIVPAYRAGGASCVSVLTEPNFFQGSLNDLIEARAAAPDTPLLRKDFTVDPYQIIEAAAYGADAILLIAAALSSSQIQELAAVAKEYKLSVLFEVHDGKELMKVCRDVDMVGVNNRNLKYFSVDTQRSIDLFPEIDKQFIPVSESGISEAESVISLTKAGFRGFLMGENFMKRENPGAACREFTDRVKRG